MPLRGIANCVAASSKLTSARNNIKAAQQVDEIFEGVNY
jgi:hypothetical protein